MFEIEDRRKNVSTLTVGDILRDINGLSYEILRVYEEKRRGKIVQVFELRQGLVYDFQIVDNRKQNSTKINLSKKASSEIMDVLMEEYDKGLTSLVDIKKLKYINEHCYNEQGHTDKQFKITIEVF